MLHVSTASYESARWPSAAAPPPSAAEPSELPPAGTHAASQIVQRRASLDNTLSLAYLQQKREEQERQSKEQQSGERGYRLSAERGRTAARAAMAGNNKVPMSLQKTGSTNVEFAWPHGGNEVFVIGSFSNWLSKIPLQCGSDGVWRTSLQLFPGTTYQYKFVVDGSWNYDVKAPVCHDSAGHTNNFVRP